MKIFVAGATGVLGRRSVKLLVEAGHDVTGVARSDEKAELLQTLGAKPARVDLFDPGAVTDAVAGHDVVMNLATHIPPPSKYVMPGAWKENNRIRGEASVILADAAMKNGAQRYVQESIAFVYRETDGWIDEDVPLDLSIRMIESVATAEAQVRRFADNGGAGVVLRFGFFYGHDAVHTLTQFKAARKGLSTFFGNGDGYMPSVQLDDAASAVVASLDATSGTYNVVDDEPLTRLELDAVLASAVGRTTLRRVPNGVLRMGGKAAKTLTRSQRVSNRRFKAATGWEPRYPSPREGLPAVVRVMTDAAHT